MASLLIFKQGYLRYLTIVSSLLICVAVITSCNHTYNPTGQYYDFLTGECLKSMELSPDCGVRVVDSESDVYQDIEFSFQMDYDFQYGVIGRNLLGRIDAQTRKPAKTVYNRYGDDGKRVEEAFDNIFDSYIVKGLANLHSVSTIFADEAFTLTADKDYLGIPAGENLWEALNENGIVYGLREEAGFPVDADFGYKYALDLGIKVYIPTKDRHHTIKDKVNFSLTMPVKIVMYLDWLHDCLTNPDARFRYNEVLLECSFSSDVRIL